MIEIVSCLALNTVQDLGRVGARHYGVSTSGAMDAVALAIGNSLLGNPEGAAGIEIQTFPFEARFLEDAAFAVTGADAQASLDGDPLPPWWTTTARRGQVLTLRQPRSGARSYLALAGGVDVPVILNSRSTHLRGGFGGMEGRSLKAGDVIRALPHEAFRALRLGAVPPQFAISSARSVSHQSAMIVRVMRAGEYDIFPLEMQESFWRTPWKISHQSDRGGYRLSGPPLKLPEPVEMRSYGLVAGIIQVPPSGEPIIQLSDANTAGGYPKIGAVIEADIWRLAQARLGSLIRFEEVSHAEAVDAMAAIQTYLKSVRRVADLYRAM
ncbi:biotin-dependent carboxyltransferase family protein [Terrarubrum flagellatum]|uniref:5-oxoprolinase subunit C family protein n=1 Tax=Terrirubrum flagellatum TaxID=2895980 RepID=UPI003144F2C0